MAEQRTFVFSVTFIIVFAALLSTIPAGLLGEGADPEIFTSVDPNIIAGFSDTENYQQSNFSGGQYTYDLGSSTWLCLSSGGFALGAKILIAGFLWLGGLDEVEFITDGWTERGEQLLFTEIADDADEGTARYDLRYVSNGNAAGAFIVYWNTTLYAKPADAWANDVLYVLHGIGLQTTAVIDAGTLLLDLLFFQIPEVPFLVNVILASPLWATIIFLIWYIVKESMPFV